MPTPDLLLVPRPQLLTLHGDGPPADAELHAERDESLRAEGYALDLTVDGATLRYRDENGLRYGTAIFGQIRAQSHDHLPGLRIEDWPDFPVRGFMLDISRDRVPTRATLERLVGLMALVRINQFQLYTEHTFAYRDHAAVWRDASPITPDDVHWLDGICREVGIELVPNQNCFGHMNRWLSHDAYRDRAEQPEGFELIPGIVLPASVLAPTPDNAEFALGLFSELLPNFTSRRVNVGCDETFELGLGRSSEAVARDGREAVYFEHLRRLLDPLLDRGYAVQFYADVVRRAPHLVEQIPDGAVALAWTYEAPRPGDEPLHVSPALAEHLAKLGIDPSDHDGFAANVAPLADHGQDFWVVPGTSSWNSLVGRIDNAKANLIDAAEVGRARGASGYVITDWGDNGHLQPPSVSFGPLVFGGAVSWSLAANHALDLDAVLDRYVFEDAQGVLGGALDALGRVWRGTGRRAFNASPLQAALLPHQGHLATGKPDPAKVHDVIDQIDTAVGAIERSAPACVDGDLVRHELVTAARLARLGAQQLIGTFKPADLEAVIDDQRTAWLARSRPGGLRDSLAHLETTIAR
ncbi:MAG: glycoside hydrolase family 20 zincin-like fold domain-containing protein [Acidimicrobiales bacterium]